MERTWWLIDPGPTRAPVPSLTWMASWELCLWHSYCYITNSWLVIVQLVNGIFAFFPHFSLQVAFWCHGTALAELAIFIFYPGAFVPEGSLRLCRGTVQLKLGIFSIEGGKMRRPCVHLFRLSWQITLPLLHTVHMHVACAWCRVCTVYCRVCGATLCGRCYVMCLCVLG